MWCSSPRPARVERGGLAVCEAFDQGRLVPRTPPQLAPEPRRARPPLRPSGRAGTGVQVYVNYSRMRVHLGFLEARRGSEGNKESVGGGGGRAGGERGVGGVGGGRGWRVGEMPRKGGCSVPGKGARSWQVRAGHGWPRPRPRPLTCSLSGCLVCCTHPAGGGCGGRAGAAHTGHSLKFIRR